jgi:hypothetical protein
MPGLEKILASHPLLHTAEGELFRNVIVRACGGQGLSVVAVTEKELMPRLESEIGVSAEVVQQNLQRVGKEIGAPWRQDQKYASLAAWIASAVRSD